MSRLAVLGLLAACASTPPPAEPAPTASATARSIEIREPGAPAWPPLISGKTAIVPDPGTISAASADYERLLSSWKICIDETGAVNLVEKLRSSGFPDYDSAIRRELSAWKHQPLELDGKTRCKAVSLVYELPTR